MSGPLSLDTLHEDGGNDRRAKRIRTRGNFGEYAPLALLVALVEAGGGALTLLIVLFVYRVLHPLGMFAAKDCPVPFACRGGGILVTQT